MIKVNLLRNISGGQATSGTPGPVGASGSTEAVVKQMAAMKGAALLVPTLILFGIEKYNISILNDKLNDTNQQIAKIEQQIKSYGETGPLLDKYSVIKAKLEKQFNALETIGNNRLREVKTLDDIQTIIPGRNWLTDVSIDEKGVVALTGFAETPDTAFSFVKAIEENPNFSAVGKISVTSANPTAPNNSAAKNDNGLKKYSFEFKIGKSP